jgi:Fe-S-cluster-containing hydrogenase component 2
LEEGGHGKEISRNGTLGYWNVRALDRDGLMKTFTATRMERCIGCHSCSLACARLVHKSLSWDRAGIRIRSSGGLSTGFEANTCLACNPAPCAQACPTGAYSQRKGGGVIVRKKLCIRCGQCEKACPVDAIYLNSVGEPFVCIHCGRCVPFCPHDCLDLKDTQNAGRDEREQKEAS